MSLIITPASANRHASYYIASTGLLDVFSRFSCMPLSYELHYLLNHNSELVMMFQTTTNKHTAMLLTSIAELGDALTEEGVDDP